MSGYAPNAGEKAEKDIVGDRYSGMRSSPEFTHKQSMRVS